MSRFLLPGTKVAQRLGMSSLSLSEWSLVSSLVLCSCGGLAGEASLIEARGGRRFIVELRCGVSLTTKVYTFKDFRDARGALE